MVTLEQWQALIAVADSGSYAKGADSLNKGQSTVSYAIKQIEDSLSIKLFSIEGRRSKITPEGEVLLKHARSLVDQSRRINELGKQFSEGAEPKISITIEAIYPNGIVLEALHRFADEQPDTHIDYRRSVLSGSEQALLEHHSDIVIGPRIPPGFFGESLGRFKFIAVAAPEHPLNKMKRQLTQEDLEVHRQLVVRDTGIRNLDGGWLGAQQRWTVDSPELSIDAALQGMGFAWYAEALVQPHLNSGRLKPLDLEVGKTRFAELYLILTDGKTASRGVKRLAQLIKMVQSAH